MDDRERTVLVVDDEPRVREVLSDYSASLAPLGAPSEFAPTGKSLRGGMTIRSYRIRAGNAVMDLTTMTLPDGRIDQYVISRES